MKKSGQDCLKTAAGNLMLAGCIMLSACSLGDILTGVETQYQVQGKTDDAETSAYLQTILDERVREKTGTLTDEEDADLTARRENYIEQTIRADLLKALAAKGYYNARVSFEEGEDPLSGTYKIEYGPQYKVATLDVLPNVYKVNFPDAVSPGDILDAQRVLETQNTLYDTIQKNHCYYRLNVTNQVYLDRAAASAEIDLVVDAGREGNFGPLAFTGNDTVKGSYLRKLVPWKEGDCFRREKLESYKATLLQSGLFARAEFSLPDEPKTDGTVPVTLDLRERAQRTISAGLNYYSDEGPGGVLSWEHRNLFGAAEKFKAALNLSTLKQSLDLDFSKPYFLRNDQTLSLNSSLRRQDTDAFEELSYDIGGNISRSFTPHLSGSTGLELSLLRIDDKTTLEKNTYGLLSAPQTLGYDTRDDTLDPHKGWNANIMAQPFFDVLGESNPFFKTHITGSTYLAFGTTADLVLAMRAGLGSIWGSDLEDIPATERFYAGGGGSVRGYGFQEVGPQENGDPTGGLSIATMSFEFRAKVTEKFGAVAFVDTGSVSEESSPDFSKMAIGAGVGVRYYTSFGPIRFDIATPLTQKDDLDQNYQFYISIGQAF